MSDSLCVPMNCSLPGSSCPWDFSGKNTGVGCHFLLQGIFLTQGLNLYLLCLLHYRWFLYLLSHQGSLSRDATHITEVPISCYCYGSTMLTIYFTGAFQKESEVISGSCINVKFSVR